MTYLLPNITPVKNVPQTLSDVIVTSLQHGCSIVFSAFLFGFFGCPVVAGEQQQVEAVVQRVYATRMDYAHWHTEASRFSCRLSQDIKRFGSAEFERRAGLGSRFTLHAQRNPLAEGNANLVSHAPVWAPDLPERNLAKVDVQLGKKPIEVGERLAKLMLTELQRGMAPQFQAASQFDQQSTVIGLSSKHFLGAYQRYVQCVSQLFPKSFEQIARTRVHFDTDKHSLNEQTRMRLDEIIEYSKLDRSVTRIYVDGHTDNVHGPSYNIGLSKRRANAVSVYLAAHGIDKKKLVTRYHGARYPVVANSSDENRSKNRRVTLRLER